MPGAVRGLERLVELVEVAASANEAGRPELVEGLGDDDRALGLVPAPLLARGCGVPSAV